MFFAIGRSVRHVELVATRRIAEKHAHHVHHVYPLPTVSAAPHCVRGRSAEPAVITLTLSNGYRHPNLT